MKLAVLGKDGPLPRALRGEAEKAGHTLVSDAADAAVYFPGTTDELARIVSDGRFPRLVLRSNAFAYGSNAKNPGLMTEDRISLLPEGARDERWLRLEEAAAKHPNSVALRLANVLSDTTDLIPQQLWAKRAYTILGHDPNIQATSLHDAARALLAAAGSSATGLFNIAGGGVIPLKTALRASGTAQIPLPKPLAQRRLEDHSADQLQFNWTVSGDRAARELNFTPRLSTVAALRDFLLAKPGSHPEQIEDAYDAFGLDRKYLAAWGWWFAFLRNIYWRIEHEGMENIPSTGSALFVSNHRGFMPLDAVMHLSLVLTHRQRVIRFLIIHTLLRTPVMADFLTKVGGVIANQENAERLVANGELIGLFPEGIRGTFTPYKQTHQLRDFAKSAFVKMAIENQIPIIPTAVIGHAEIFPILGRIDSSWVTRELGWPYLPIAPMFPLAPVPLPSKWHVRVLPPVSIAGLSRSDAENVKIIRDVSRYVQSILQSNIDQMVSRRKHIFWGRIFDGAAVPLPSKPLSMGAAAGK